MSWEPWRRCTGCGRWCSEGQTVGYGDGLRWWVTEREAIDTIWAGVDWWELVAECADEQFDLADRLTGEGG